MKPERRFDYETKNGMINPIWPSHTIFLFYDMNYNIFTDEDGFKVDDINEWIPPYVAELFFEDLKTEDRTRMIKHAWRIAIDADTNVVIQPICY